MAWWTLYKPVRFGALPGDLGKGTFADWSWWLFPSTSIKLVNEQIIGETASGTRLSHFCYSKRSGWLGLWEDKLRKRYFGCQFKTFRAFSVEFAVGVRFLKVPKMFSYSESSSKISLIITELLYSHTCIIIWVLFMCIQGVSGLFISQFLGSDYMSLRAQNVSGAFLN